MPSWPVRGRGVSALHGRVVVLSPHLDDAVLSLGATIARAVRTGVGVEVVTVFAGDPDSEASAGRWDAAAGFATEGEAASTRRQEDRRACQILGAEPVWLAFGDKQYERGGDDVTIQGAVVERLAGKSIALIPGSPLVHSDHAFINQLLLADDLPCARIGLYRELPYGSTRWAGRERAKGRTFQGVTLPEVPPFEPTPIALRDRTTKWRAVREYRSQLRLLESLPGRVFPRLGEEAISWLPDRYRDRRT